MVQFNYLTDIGAYRSHNDDVSLVVKNEWDQVLLVVCDGLGGYAGSSTASLIVSDTIKDAFLRTDLKMIARKQESNEALEEKEQEEAVLLENNKSESCSGQNQIRSWLIELIHQAQNKITQQANIDDQAYQMATTLVVCLIINNQVYTMNIGDSRAYLLTADKGFNHIGYDHNVLNRLKQMNAEPNLYKKYEKNLYSLTQYIGRLSNVVLTYDFYVNQLKKHDIIFLASDGFYPYYEMNNLYSYLTNEDDKEKIQQTLLKTVIDNDSQDNISFAYYIHW
ncbi:serine/threonine-protein phosphatase [Ureaplasma sp. ES3154-GEN]|uniref:PP2C family protein-serine/threonine phosphatase n=1 Tax=Ureaplasma sp. ES3154-GEN TaxID=2984844 RepID=UPI0021E774BC|nr:PP2C family serine/threonine-protein phosphatase [Ureaplasma sp. ES3154-GEN]MCV3743809.1 serine/threonine-protein phosphatase [Ureaplasma sp. ES3154-GEN]